ncbi:hypothetical protein SRHO_G00206600 [Serrasalmus rhombeus]
MDLGNMRDLLRKTQCSIVEKGFMLLNNDSLKDAVGSDGVRVMMESALTARDRVGVQDFVLLENHTSEVAFIENLRKRFKRTSYIHILGQCWCL